MLSLRIRLAAGEPSPSWTPTMIQTHTQTYRSFRASSEWHQSAPPASQSCMRRLAAPPQDLALELPPNLLSTLPEVGSSRNRWISKWLTRWPPEPRYLVEAQSDYYVDLLCAVSVAGKLVAKAGGGEVSMSWGGEEPAYFNAQYPTQTSMDPVFTQRGVVYFASAGDSPGPIYPSTSPNVVSAGGTTLSTNATTGNFLFENAWQDGGGGLSIVESRPRYQDPIASLVGTQRGTPDVAADANPYTGVWLQDSFPVTGVSPCNPGTPCWYIVGGTSVSAPMIAGIVNAADSFSESSHQELSKIYSKPFGFSDIVLGNCGLYIGNFATRGWDFCTGWGSPKGYFGK